MSTNSNVSFVVSELQKITTINKDNVITTVVHAMTIVRKLNNLSGEEKKETVLRALSLLIDYSDLSLNDKTMVKLMLDMTVPDVIDNLVAASNGILKFKNKKGILCCFSKPMSDV